MKIIFDYFFAIVGLIIFFPFLILIGFLIKLTSNGSIFYTQERIGRNGVSFKIIKFRSMHENHGDSNTITVLGDSRVTTLGRILRKYKLDELPEIMNILKGEMSFVGPRPDVKFYTDKLEGDELKILQLKPGITSLASLKYANEEEILAKQNNPKKYTDSVIYPDKVNLNLDYYHNRSIWLDIKIIFATIFRKSY
jgi:lipopolysaccharide/colanic/teichoic acid biosynthesis glycosyltransferase